MKEATTTNQTGTFVGRTEEIIQLRRAYEARAHVLIVGRAGIGKTALLRHAQNQLGLIVCEEASSMRRICESLERHFGWRMGCIRHD